MFNLYRWILSTKNSNIPSTPPPEHNGSPEDSKDQTFSYNLGNQPMERAIANPFDNSREVDELKKHPISNDIEKHRNRHLINSNICGLSCKTHNCKKGERVCAYSSLIIQNNMLCKKSMHFWIQFLIPETFFSSSHLEYLVAKYP